MNNNSKSTLPLLIIAAGLGAIAGAISVLLARKESREYLRERGTKGLEYVNQTGAKLRQSSAGLIEKGREFMNRCCAPTDSVADAEHGDKPEIH